MINQPSILVVDDEPAIVAGLVLRLKHAGYRATGVHSGAEALASAAKTPPDLVLLDLDLPDRDGRDVLLRIRADPSTCGVPVVLLSGAEMSKQNALDAGASAALRKPYRKEELLELVHDLLAGGAA